jgi:hypothetical protein
MLCAALSALIRSASSETLGPDLLPSSGVAPDSPNLSADRLPGVLGAKGDTSLEENGERAVVQPVPRIMKFVHDFLARP